MPRTSWKNPLLAATFLVIPVFEIYRWIKISIEVSGGHAERVAAYLAPLPDFLHDTTLKTFILIGFCLAAASVSFRGIDMKGLPRFLCLLQLVIASVLTAWLMFTLM